MTHTYSCCDCAIMSEVKFNTMTFAQNVLEMTSVKFKVIAHRCIKLLTVLDTV